MKKGTSVSGEYISVDYVKITKKVANQALGSGVSEDIINKELSKKTVRSIFGLLKIYFSEGKKVLEFKNQDITSRIISECGDQKSFFMVREESGDCFYDCGDGGKSIKKDSLALEGVRESLNGYGFEYFDFSLKIEGRGIELEMESSEPKFLEYYIIDPNGIRSAVEIVDDVEQSDSERDWNAPSVLKVSFNSAEVHRKATDWLMKVWLSDSPQIQLTLGEKDSNFTLQGPYGELYAIVNRLETFGDFEYSIL